MNDIDLARNFDSIFFKKYETNSSLNYQYPTHFSISIYRPRARVSSKGFASIFDIALICRYLTQLSICHSFLDNYIQTSGQRVSREGFVGRLDSGSVAGRGQSVESPVSSQEESPISVSKTQTSNVSQRPNRQMYLKDPNVKCLSKTQPSSVSQRSNHQVSLKIILRRSLKDPNVKCLSKTQPSSVSQRLNRQVSLKIILRRSLNDPTVKCLSKTQPSSVSQRPNRQVSLKIILRRSLKDPTVKWFSKKLILII